MPYLFKIALSDVDVRKATPEQCSIHSEYNSPKIDSTKDHFLNVNITFDNEPPTPASGTTNTLTLFELEHGYKYVPEVWFHVDATPNFGGTVDERYGPGATILSFQGAASIATLRASVDKDVVRIYLEKSWTSPASPPNVAGQRVETRLYIFADQAF